jgi:hypothetical protein
MFGQSDGREFNRPNQIFAITRGIHKGTTEPIESTESREFSLGNKIITNREAFFKGSREGIRIA